MFLTLCVFVHQTLNRSMARELKGSVKEILGTCVSVGCTVDGKPPQEVSNAITAGEIEIPEK